MVSEINLISEVLKFLLTVLAAGFGAWLSVRIFPMKAKQDEWRWRRRLEAQEFIFDKLSEIMFMIHGYLSREYSERYSMAGLSGSDTEKVVYKNLKALHKRSESLRLILPEKQVTVFDKFLSESQSVMDNAVETWGQWDEDDYHAMEVHTHKTLDDIHEVVSTTLDEFKKAIISEQKK